MRVIDKILKNPLIEEARILLPFIAYTLYEQRRGEMSRGIRAESKGFLRLEEKPHSLRNASWYFLQREFHSSDRSFNRPLIKTFARYILKRREDEVLDFLRILRSCSGKTRAEGKLTIT